MKQRFVTLSARFIFVFFSVNLIWLIVVAGTSTAQITLDSSEYTFFIRDSIWQNLFFSFVLFCFLLSVRLLRKRLRIFMTDHPWSTPRRIKLYLLTVIFLLSLAFVISSQLKPRADQLSIMECASQWINRDYSSITTPGGYLDQYPQQYGIVLILYFFSLFFGANNYLAFQVFNVFFLTWFYWSMSEIVDLLYPESNTAGICFLLLGMIYYPLIMYTSFVYGTIIGLALCTEAFKLLIKHKNHFNWVRMILFTVLLFMATAIKQNHLIFVIGLFISLIVEMLRESKWKFIIPCMGMACILLFSSTIIQKSVAYITGTEARENSGVSAYSYIAMGMQKHENNELYDGWWNHYNTDSYAENNYNSEEQATAAKLEIERLIGEFVDDPGYAVRFFAGKNISQWNNPDFQSVWINAIREKTNTDLQSPDWIIQLFSVQFAREMSWWMDKIHFFILLGALLYILFNRNKGFIAFNLCIIFIGGFVFHTVWEAKCQYTITYFVLLFPLSVCGWIGLVNRISIQNLKKKEMLLRNKGGLIVLSACFILAIIVQSGVVPVLNDTVKRDETDSDYQIYLMEHPYLKNGRYYIFNAGQNDQYLYAEKSNELSAPLYMTDKATENSVIYLQNSEKDVVSFCFDVSNKHIDVPSGNAVEGNVIWTYEGNGTNAQRWKLTRQTKDSDISYYIMFENNLALTLNPEDGSLYLSPKTDS